MSEQGGTSTHAQRREAQSIKSQWTDEIVSGSQSLVDLVKAAQGSSKEAKYLSSILLVDLLAQVHPGLSRSQIIGELESLPIKLPADPARFKISSIRSKPDLVAQVEAMLQSSTMTKSARGRTDVPPNWPWGTKLSELARINGGEVPQGLEWLEGTGDEPDPSDMLLSAPDIAEPMSAQSGDDTSAGGEEPESLPGEELAASDLKEGTAETAGEDAPATDDDDDDEPRDDDDDHVDDKTDDDEDPIAQLEAEFGLDEDLDDVEVQQDDADDDSVLDDVFGDIFGAEDVR
jgi:hypothetical protein